MGLFQKRVKPVNKIKLYRLILFSAVAFISISCASKEDREITALMTSVFQKELDIGKGVFVFEEAEENWEIPWLDTCSSAGLLSLESDFHPKVSISDIFTLEDADKICKEGRKPYKFQQDMFPEGVVVSPDKSRYDSILDAFYKHIGDPEIVELDMELKKYSEYKSISKPVFLQDNYAFLYISREGPHLSIYKKENGEWAHYFTITLMLI